MRTFFIVFFGLLSILPLKAEESKPVLDEKTWEKVTKNVDYTENEREKRTWNFPNFNIDINPKAVQYVFFFIIIGALLFFLVKYIMALQSTRADEEHLRIFEVDSLDEAEANPMNADLEKLIQKLIQNKDYRGAIRANFLLILQLLNRKELIEWKKPKTNFDYVNEISKQDYHADFYALTQYFEWIWYGNHTIEQPTYKELEQEFKTLVSTINRV